MYKTIFKAVSAIIIAGLTILLACNDKEYKEPPVGLNNKIKFGPIEVSDVSYRTATVRCDILQDGDMSFSEKGFCYGTEVNPDYTGDKTTGNLADNLQNLLPGTQYYVRAYLTVSGATIYSADKTLNTTALAPPELKTVEVTNIAVNSAKSGGTVTEINGSEVIAQGVCWSTSKKPTIEDNYSFDTIGNNFTSKLDSLKYNTTYFVRAYATNEAGTAYGNEISFTTSDGSLADINTSDIIDITIYSATAGGNITSNGGLTVTARGICWSTNPQPTVNDSITIDGNGTGLFVSELSNLNFNTTYYARAYAINEAGTAYGPEKTFSTNDGKATVSTIEVNDITVNSATVGGNVTSDGGLTVTARGVCWSTNSSPTVGDSIANDSQGLGSFTSTLSSLHFNTKYYIRAFATNEAGTVYGTEKTFTTRDGLAAVTTNTVSDITVNSATVGGNVTSDGGLFVTARGVCWSTSSSPTINDSIVINGSGTGSFTNTLSSLHYNTKYYIRAFATNEAGTVYGPEKTFSTDDGKAEVTTNTISNITATSATVGGDVTFNGGLEITERGVCWSTSLNPDINDNKIISSTGTGVFSVSLTGLTRATYYYVKAFVTNSAGTVYGTVKQFTTMPDKPSITTSTEITASHMSAICGGNISDDGGANVIERGVCWSTSSLPDIDDNKKTSGSGIESFTEKITGLELGTKYYVRAFATNSQGTSYGSSVSFITKIVAEDEFQDIDGNVYKTVTIGDQIWMAANLAVTHYNDGTEIIYGTNSSATPVYYWYDNDEETYKDNYGALYNWPVVETGKVCPTGWHVPTFDEWTQLEEYLIANGYNYDGSTSGHKTAKSLASTNGWSSSSILGQIGNDMSSNNSTGFTAKPGGYFYSHNGTFNIEGDLGTWWSSTEFNNEEAWNCGLRFDRAFFAIWYIEKQNGCSIRCLKD